MDVVGQGPSNLRLPMIDNNAAEECVVKDSVRFTRFQVCEVFLHANRGSAYVSFVEPEATNTFFYDSEIVSTKIL